MIIWINEPEPFDAAVIVRFLYYATGFENVKVHITNIKKFRSFVNYSRIPIEEIKKINRDIPSGKFLVIDKNGKNVDDIDINNYDGFVIDFSGRIEGEKVKALGLNDLAFESIAVLSRIFIRKENFEKKVYLDEEIEKDKYYIAKKLLEGIRNIDVYNLISPRLILFVLRNIEKRFRLLVDIEKVEIELKYNKVVEKIYIKFYDSKLRSIDEDIVILEDNNLEIPILYGNKKKRLKFFIDFDKRIVYISKDNYISEVPMNYEEVLRDFFNL